MRHARLPGVVVLLCALALTSTAALAAPPAAGSRAIPRMKQTRTKQTKHVKKKAASVARCVTLAQETTSGQTLDLSLTNACAAHLSCSLGWVVRCGGARDTTTHPGAESLVLAADGGSQTVTASAAECGYKSWRIGAIRWRCTRN